jgi:DNA repair protein RecO (recombination protein O)
MIKKTEGIVLRTLKHQDSNLITTVYTKEFGVRSFMLKGYRSGRGRNKHSYFQPLSIIDLVFMHRAHRSLQTVTESKCSYLLQTVQTTPVKLSLGLAIVEIFSDTVKEEEPNPEMYEHLYDTLIKLDQTDRRLVHIFIYFVLQLGRYLGFGINDQSQNSQYVHFDYKKGSFFPSDYQKEPISYLLRRFYYSDLHSCGDITFDNDQKRNLIKTVFSYYQEHIEGFRYPQTLKVFAEVFG